MLEEYGIKEDPRLKRARKEFFIVVSIWAVYSIVYLAYVFGVGKNPNAVVLGVPWWFNLLWISLIFLVIVIIATKNLIENIDLSPWLSEKKEE